MRHAQVMDNEKMCAHRQKIIALFSNNPRGGNHHPHKLGFEATSNLDPTTQGLKMSKLLENNYRCTTL
jgi:hypothetical protein